MKTELNLSKQACSFKIPFTADRLVKSKFYYVQAAGIIHTKPDYFIRRQAMDSLLILYVLKGNGILRYKKNEYNLLKDGLFLIDCIDPHEILTDDADPLIFCFLHFNGQMSRDYAQILISDCSPYFPPSTGTGKILKTMRELILTLKKGDVPIQIMCSGQIHTIPTELMILGRIHFSEYGDRPEYFKKVLAFIEEHYFEEITLDDLAQQAALSKYHLTRLFKAYCGRSAYDYLLSFRLNKAKEWLLNSEETIGQIAALSGFKDLSHFNRSFKHHEGLSPSEYKRQFLQGEGE